MASSTMIIGDTRMSGDIPMNDSDCHSQPDMRTELFLFLDGDQGASGNVVDAIFRYFRADSYKCMVKEAYFKLHSDSAGICPIGIDEQSLLTLRQKLGQRQLGKLGVDLEERGVQLIFPELKEGESEVNLVDRRIEERIDSLKEEIISRALMVSGPGAPMSGRNLTMRCAFAVVSTDKYYAHIFRQARSSLLKAGVEVGQLRNSFDSCGVVEGTFYQIAHATNKSSRKLYEGASTTVLTYKDLGLIKPF